MNSPHNSSILADTETDHRWAAVVGRDAQADGKFYYSVETTGIYCRPSCAARRARLANVRFHATAVDAERAGFRPCLRCKPDQPPASEQNAARIAAACRFIEQAEEAPGLTLLAAHAGLSASRFHHLFKSITGLTPKQYATAYREQRVRQELPQSGTVTEAIYASGYNSSARFYTASNLVLGMTPSRYRAGGALTDIRFAIGSCSLGSILVAQTERGICTILLGDDPDALACDLQDRFPHANLLGGDPAFEQVVAAVVSFVEVPAAGLNLPLDIQGTVFQKRVWQALTKIPAGTTASYTDIARAIGSPSAVRAVAQACGANPIAVAIPCHRVVRTGGALSGYRWGVDRKRALLEKEARA